MLVPLAALLWVLLALPVTTQAADYTFTKIADTNTSVPDSNGTFINFLAPGLTPSEGTVALDGSDVAFVGRGDGDVDTGLYLFSDGTLQVVADTNTVIPGFMGFNFDRFGFPSLDSGKVGFWGQKSGSDNTKGVYLFNPGNPISVIANTNTLVPGETLGFTQFSSYVSLDGSNVAFEGHQVGTLDHLGIHFSDGTVAPSTVADLDTLIPGGAGAFTNLTPPSMDQGEVAFGGKDPESFFLTSGIYLWKDGVLSVVADQNTLIPGIGTTFGLFFAAFGDSMSLDDGKVAFMGGQAFTATGVYIASAGNVSSIVDINTTIPGTLVTFSEFLALSLDDGNVAFEAYDDNGIFGNGGIFISVNGALTKVIVPGDMLDGKTVARAALGREGLSGRSVAFHVRFIDGSEGVYRADPLVVGDNPSIDIETSTNGQDADTPPGPSVLVGDPVTWTYDIINTGDTSLTNIQVVDDQGVTITCPMSVLAVAESMNCTASGVAEVGQYANIGSVTGTPPVGPDVGGSDPSHYFGVLEEEPTKILLLLHGMNSDPLTWGDFVKHKFSNKDNCATIFDGYIHGNPTPNEQRIYCYRVEFGAHDSGTGLEESPLPSKSKGDFSTFEELGQEVDSAVQSLTDPDRHPNAEIVLIGHSRGGIAARQFLQDSNYSSGHVFIKGLLTIGTPHRGSPLGRFWHYLSPTNGGYTRSFCEEDISPIPGIILIRPCIKDWRVVDFLREDGGLISACGAVSFLRDDFLDVRTPTIGYLSDQSPEISKLNSNISQLYNGSIIYGQLKYGGVDLGILSRLIDKKRFRLYSIFDSKGRVDACPQVTAPKDIYDFLPNDISAWEYMLGADTDKLKGFKGDGLVPYGRQGYIKIPNFPSDVLTHDEPTHGKSPLHTEEPEQVDDIDDALSNMMGSWWESNN